MKNMFLSAGTINHNTKHLPSHAGRMWGACGAHVGRMNPRPEEVGEDDVYIIGRKRPGEEVPWSFNVGLK